MEQTWRWTLPLAGQLSTKETLRAFFKGGKGTHAPLVDKNTSIHKLYNSKDFAIGFSIGHPCQLAVKIYTNKNIQTEVLR